MSVSLVIETWNIAEDQDLFGLEALLESVDTPASVEIVVTHVEVPSRERQRVESRARRSIRWVSLPPKAGYYEHKNRGFEASRGDVVVFLDGDCEPAPGWLAAITKPFEDGARVVAGATSYAGDVAPLANAIDFPYFDGARGRRRAISDRPRHVRNFFANNVAFERSLFDAHPYPRVDSMFHGQCQILAMSLAANSVAIEFACEALVTHAWPESLRAFIETRLLRGADAGALLPHVARHYAPRAAPTIEKLGSIATLALLAARTAAGTRLAVRTRSRARSLGFVAATAILDSLGATFSSRVYKHYGVTS